MREKDKMYESVSCALFCFDYPLFSLIMMMNRIYIYTLAGQLYKQQAVEAGETVIDLPQRFYIVVMDGKQWKVAAP